MQVRVDNLAFSSHSKHFIPDFPSYVDEVIELVVKKNPDEPEFHQAVKEVLESLRAVVEAHEEEYRRDALLERLVEPERQIKFRVPWVDDKGQVQVNTGYLLNVLLQKCDFAHFLAKKREEVSRKKMKISCI